LKALWRIPGEAKGRELNESQIAAVVDLLDRYDAIAEMILIDMAGHTPSELSAYQVAQADRITANITPEHQPAVVESLRRLRDECLELSSQLFIEAFLIIRLIDAAIQTATLYYVQRAPEELGRFSWVVDRKGKSITAAESLWKALMLPMMESASFRKPLVKLVGADYSVFDARFEICEENASEATKQHIEWLRQIRPPEVGPDARPAIDIKAIMRDLTFADSATEDGLQLADVGASAFRRAFNGTLGWKGWKRAGRLLVRRSEDTVHVVKLTTDPNLVGGRLGWSGPMVEIVEQLERNAKNMILPSMEKALSEAEAAARAENGNN
jgi:hypothetical protein